MLRITVHNCRTQHSTEQFWFSVNLQTIVSQTESKEKAKPKKGPANFASVA